MKPGKKQLYSYLFIHLVILLLLIQCASALQIRELNLSDPTTAKSLQTKTLELLKPDRNEVSPTLGKQMSDHDIKHVPAPNYINPASRKTLLFKVEIPLIAITTLVVLARLYARGVLAKDWNVGWDDLFMCFALICAIALTVLQCVSCNYGWGLHIWDVLPYWISPMRKLAFAIQITFITCVTATKVSILIFYLRLVAISPVFRLFVLLGIAYTIAFWFSFFVTILVQCEPLRSFWELSITHVCINEPAANTANAVLNCFGDIYVFLLPIQTFWHLRHLPKARRIGLIVVFCLGFVVCVVGCLRVWYLEGIIEKSDDSTWNGVILYILTAIECDLAIICGCLPALKQIYNRFVEKVLPKESIENLDPSSQHDSHTQRLGSGGRRPNAEHTGDEYHNFVSDQVSGREPSLQQGPGMEHAGWRPDFSFEQNASEDNIITHEQARSQSV